MIDFINEIKFQTTRSGGKGGQNVNKVETAVIATFYVGESVLLSEEQKNILLAKLKNKIDKDGKLLVKSQTFRTQLENKKNAVAKINKLLNEMLQKKKLRIITKIPAAINEKRLETKKRRSTIKAERRKDFAREF